jgi:hypothetical protein
VSFTIASTLQFPNPGVKVRNEWVLWQAGQQRGGDVTLPGVNGLLPRRRYLTATTHTLELIISGTAVYTGSPSGTPAANLQTNILWLRDTVCEPTGTTDGTKAISVTMPTGTLTGTVHVLGFRLGRVAEHARWAFATMDLSIPAGELAYTP